MQSASDLSAGLARISYEEMEADNLRNLNDGRYLKFDRPVSLVRSTISLAFSHDEKLFASTHGDHRVRLFKYPSGKQISNLEGHSRTPWVVRFHPTDSSIVASGCLNGECRIWNVNRGECVRIHNFEGSISGLSFSPDGTLLAITNGRKLWLWEYKENTEGEQRSTRMDESDDGQGPGQPREVIEGSSPLHSVDFHPSGTMLITGEKNKYTAVSEPHHELFTLRLVIHRFDGSIESRLTEVALVVPRVVAYNYSGIGISPCGKMLAVCVPRQGDDSSRAVIAVMSLIDNGAANIGSILYYTKLDHGHVVALTSLKFSPSSKHLLAGYSFRPTNPVIRGQVRTDDDTAAASGGAEDDRDAFMVSVIDIHEVADGMAIIKSVRRRFRTSDWNSFDEINAALFAPAQGVAGGLLYGTQNGNVCLFSSTNRPISTS